MKESDFIFYLVQLMYYKSHKVHFKSGGSYIDSPDWIKGKTTIYPKNEDDKCFHYETTIALNCERVSNIKPFINKYNWEGTNYPSKIGDWKTFEKNNPTIVLNVLYTNKKETLPAYISKHNSTRE